MPFSLAVVRLERAEMPVASDRLDESSSLLTDARGAFEQLEARPWLEGLDAVAVGARCQPDRGLRADERRAVILGPSQELIPWISWLLLPWRAVRAIQVCAKCAFPMRS